MSVRWQMVGLVGLVAGCQWGADKSVVEAEVVSTTPGAVQVFAPYVTDPLALAAPVASPDLDGIAAAVQQQLPALESCYAGGLEKDPMLGGEMAIHFSVDGSGDLVEACISTEDAPPVLMDCMNQLVQTADFPPSEGQPVDVTLPVHFGA